MAKILYKYKQFLFNNGKIPIHHAKSANMNNQHSDFLYYAPML
jgi:hypothetical protein